MNKNIRDYINLIENAQIGESEGVAEGSENNNPIAQKIFFARSNKTPKGWSYDHVGFITQDGKQIQMSGHKGNDVYVTNAVTDDPEFPKQNIKIVSLSKPVSVPTTNSVGAENCGTFVANVLQANGIKGIDTQKIYSVFKKPQEQGVAEEVPQPGPSSGAPKQFGPDAKIQTRQMTAKQLIASVPGLPYYNNVVDDWDAKDYSWGVTKKVIEYATYLKDHPESLAKLPPILVLNGKFEDGAHRVSAIWLLQQRMDPKNPLWTNAKLNVQFIKTGVAEAGYGNHPSQRVDPRTGKRYVPPKSPLGKRI